MLYSENQFKNLIVFFLKNGTLVWQGSNQEIFKTDNEDVTDFVYSSDLFKKIRDIQIKEH